MNDMQKSIDELKNDLHDLKIIIEKLNNSNKKSWFTRFKIWLKKTDPEGLSNYDGIVAAGILIISVSAFTAVAAYLGSLPQRMAANNEPTTIQAKVDVAQDWGAE